MFKILLCEDDAKLRDMMQKYIVKHGYEVTAVHHGQEGIEYFNKQKFDLIITDIMMPHIDGYALTKHVRNYSSEIPILMYSALESIDDKSRGYLEGIDDYMVKPIELKEMLFKIKALLKRYELITSHRLIIGNMTLDYQKKECKINDKLIELTLKEFDILFKLFASPGIIFTREQIMNDIWSYDAESYDRTVDTHIKRIREKVVSDAIEIKTIRGLGYKGVIV